MDVAAIAPMLQAGGVLAFAAAVWWEQRGIKEQIRDLVLELRGSRRDSRSRGRSRGA